MAKLFGLDPAGFAWATGIECTFIPQTDRPAERTLDEYELTEHYTSWREDLDLTAQLGVNAMRFGVPWYRIERSPGQFDWDWTDHVLAYAAELGIEVIADLVHFGTPLWLEGQFLDPSYPQRVAEFASVFARRYRDSVSAYTPQNSPSVTAFLCGDLGMWPPYLQGADGAVRLIQPMARGIALTVEAIRDASPDATIVSIDGALEFRPAALDTLPDPNGHPAVAPERATVEGAATVLAEVQEAATILSLRTFMASDLVQGRVDASHPLVDWLTKHGMTEANLMWHQEHAADADVVGLNYYPQFTVRSLREDADGVTPHSQWGGVAGLERAVRAFANRYSKPVMITETDVNGTVEQRAGWLRDSTEAVPRMRQEGLPLVGYTWWPLYSLVDWGYRTGSARFFDPDQSPVLPRSMSVASYLDPMGLYDLEPGVDGSLGRVRTPLADQYAAAIRKGQGLLEAG